MFLFFFFFSSRRRHTRCGRDWSSDVCSSDLIVVGAGKFQLTPLYLAPEPFCRVVGIEYICRIPIAGTLRTRGANDERSHLNRDIALAVDVLRHFPRSLPGPG